jgi:UDP-N-acetylmuramate dehydrogenase
MIIVENVSLKPYNTFGIDVMAKSMADVRNLQDIQIFLNTSQFKNIPMFILGGGSNVLFTKDFDGVVVKISSKGILKIRETDDFVFLNVQAGIEWNEFVNYCLQNNLGGVENLALIPGTVGSSPIQNIGAYGVEAKDVIDSVEVVNIQNLQMFDLKNEECKFGYRNSIFKNELKGKVIISSVSFRLNKKHKLNFNYGAIREEFNKAQINEPTIKDVANAVSAIRRAKLPDPKEIGNSGSFFKNPSIDKQRYEALVAEYPVMPSYTQTDGTYKIPAGWMIEQCGWKGHREGDAGVHKDQALVLVNYGNAKGQEILNLANKIQKSVKEKFKINLEMEVNVV